MKIKKSPTFIFLILLLHSQVVPQPSETAAEPLKKLSAEAPRSFIATEWNSADVELFAQGYWEALVASSGTFSFGSPLPPLFNPVPLFFRQQPDIYLLLILQKQWWTELSVTDDLSRTLFALGYTGQDHDFLKEVRLGNSGISMRNYPGMAFGVTKNALGILAQAEDAEKGISADAMVRWDGLSYATKRFLGSLAFEETAYSAASWVRGRRFVLPDSPVTSIVLREEREGVTRVLGAEEYSIRNAYGFIELPAEPLGILYADYTSNMVTKSVELYQKNKANPYEAKNLYAVSAGSNSSDYFVRSRKTMLADTGYSIRVIAPSLLEITKGENPSYDSDYFKKPFSETDPWIYDPITKTTEFSYPPGASFEFASRSLKETAGIQIEQNAVAGSIGVWRNGIATTLFSYDPSSGSIELTPVPGEGEEIIVRYALESNLKGNNGLVFGFGVGWPLGEFVRGQAAIGGRWPFPGQSYAESGTQHPSWLGLSLSAETKPITGAGMSWNSSIFSRLVRAEASGIYRISGMEDFLTYAAPFRPVSGDTLTVVSAAVASPDFTLAWPEYDKKIHLQNEKSMALRLKATSVTGARTRFVNFQESVPLALYKKFVFFFYNETAEGTGSITVHAGDGNSGLTIRDLSIASLPHEWLRIEVDLQADGRVIANNSRGEPVLLEYSAVEYVPISAGGFVYFELADFLDGSILIDELHLEDPYAGFNSQFQGSIQYRFGDAPEDAFTKGSVNATIGSAAAEFWDFSLSSDLAAGFDTGPARWRLSVKPVYSGNSFDLGTSYSILLPKGDFPVRVSEYFFRQPGSRLFAHKLQATGGITPFHASLTQETVDNDFLFSQTWLAATEVPDWISLKMTARNLLSSSVLETMAIPATWLESWTFLKPYRETDASKRSLALELTAAPHSALTASATRNFDANALSESALNGRISWPFKISIATVTPFYERKLFLQDNSASVSFMEDYGKWLAAMQNCAPLIIEYPFKDLFDDMLTPVFKEVCGNLEKADYLSGTGFSVERPIGYGTTDLWAPAKVQAGIARKLQKTLDSYTDSRVFTLRLDGSAFNVFSQAGVKPFFKSFELDEYFWQLGTTLVNFSAESRIFPAVDGEYSMTLSTQSGSAFGAKIKGKYEESRIGTAWETGVNFFYNKKTAKTWLSDLIALTSKIKRPGSDVTTATKRNVVWSWFDGLKSGNPVLRNIISSELQLVYKGYEAVPCKLLLSERYETKYTIAPNLSLSVFASMSESLKLYPNYLLWGFGYELGMSARVSF